MAWQITWLTSCVASAFILAACSEGGCGGGQVAGGPAAQEAESADDASRDSAQVEVAIEHARAAEDEHGVTFFLMGVLTNRTGRTLHVRSNFLTPFSGMYLVVTDGTGKEMIREAYINHLSPADLEGEAYDLPVGETRKELAFPLQSPSFRGGDDVWISLTGGLPGTEFEDGLTSDTVEVTIDRRP